MRVLVIEDQAELADDIADGLRDQGIGADVAYDGPTGIEKALMNPYDVVVLDRDLPKVHGDAVCATLIGSRSAARILMLTAAATVGDRVQGLNLGADDYLGKPFAFEELVARVRSLAGRPPGDRARRHRARPGPPPGQPGRPAAVAHPQGDGGPGGAPGRGRRRGQHRGSARAGLGRERRPVHAHGHGDDRPAAAQAGRARPDRHRDRQRLPPAMNLGLRALLRPVRRLWPQKVRTRLTLLYAALFFAAGSALLGLTYGLVASSLPATPAANAKISSGERQKLIFECKKATGAFNGKHSVPVRMPAPAVCQQAEAAYRAGLSSGSQTQRQRALSELLSFSLA